jgi:LmbE family N-acetylglucosaminyl deacetylase
MERGLLVVTAHPDDETLIAGGTLAACAAAGLPTGVACLTRGENGPIADPRLASRETLGQVREGELHCACGRLGVSWVKCFRRRDSYLASTKASGVAPQLTRLIARHRPVALVTFAPDGLFDHPDHVAVREFVHSALRLAARVSPPAPAWLYEAMWPAAAMPELVYVMGAPGVSANSGDMPGGEFGIDAPADPITVDVRSFVATKIAALGCHRTQLGADNLFAALPEDLADRFLGREHFQCVLRPQSGPDWLTDAVGRAAAAVPALEGRRA